MATFFKTCWKNTVEMVKYCCPYFFRGRQKMAQPTQPASRQGDLMMGDDIQPLMKVQKARARNFINIDQGNTERRASETMEADEDEGLDPYFSSENEESVSMRSVSFSLRDESQPQQRQAVANPPGANMDVIDDRLDQREI